MRRLLTLLAVLGLAAAGVVVAVVLATGTDDGAPTGDPGAGAVPVAVPEDAIEVAERDMRVAEQAVQM
ncbi:hypothetical protein [uncultured Nocardioides sp.]|uniref:hypothetical protein n=1 Tax=uncultured Nocardioides sp. TaxID=198441 RepID=UPI000C680751|nr:hypothetical protein [uncultured Nocardioides sp.]MAO80396.1 hypothetical protein [Nocardioides sp.]